MLFRLIKKHISKGLSGIMAKRLKVDKISSHNSDENETINFPVSSSLSNNKIGQVKLSEGYAILPPPNKSEFDKKEYSVIRLSNGLTALLISDKSNILNLEDMNENSDGTSVESDSETSDVETDGSSVGSDEVQNPIKGGCEEKLAACALCIGVGSFSDPENIPGLAHFLEHMIFMGSEKFPKENEFDVYIKKKGGCDNASTECEYTTFYFDCHEAHLHGAMDIFSQLFISPLMKRESMTKEREAIESEFQMSLPSDESRRSQLLCSLANKHNPANKFMWGNLITLKDNVNDNDLYKAVHDFRLKHYSAHRMTLAVQARLPLEVLEKWVVECFQGVPNNGLPHDEFKLSEPPFQPKEFHKLYIVEPVKNINHLDLTWVMPSTLKMYKSKPLNYMSWVIGHEGKGSLLSYLRKKLWGFDVTVSSGGDGTEENSIYTLFSISVHLTPEGVKHIEEVLISVFKYIKMFQDVGPQERLFNEMQCIAETSFRFFEEVSSSDNVEQLSENMHFYPSTDYITGMELYFEYDPQSIQSFLKELKPDNVNIMISSKLVAATEILNQVEKWFGTKYQSKDIPKEWIDNWNNVEASEDFHLPNENMFIPTDFTILPNENAEEFPKNIVKDDILELWYKQDATFKLPHGFCCLHFISPLPHESAQNSAMLDLFIYILRQSLVEELYPAKVAQLNYSFHSGEKGLVIILNGFNEKLKALLYYIIRGINSLKMDLDKDLVFAMKDELKRSYSNSNLKTNFLVREVRMSILLENFWTALNKEEALEGVTLEKLKNFISQYFEKLYIQCLIQGNISKHEAIEFGELVKNELACKPLSANTVPIIRVNELPSGEKHCVVQSFNTQDTNSVVTNYYQSGLGTIQESCVIEFLLMMMEEPIFDTLRTKQQLGYDVSCSLRDTFGVLGFSVTVHCQSDRNTVELVESRITQFLADFIKILKETSPEEFSEVQESLIKLKKCADIHLKEEVKRNWDEIKLETYVFDRHHKEREYIEKLTLDKVIKWFEEVAGIHDTPKFKKLSTQVVGKQQINEVLLTNNIKNESESLEYIFKKELIFIPQKDTGGKFISNIKNFKDSLCLYPVHKIV
ncbi:nardilysin [Homalodisca vitripennis]|uniref:nardilysin n=1 Tax=Homalodisca vitripennis TaxID=197043 RepID=UPI001EEC6AC1|nr:nardilysin [Homalodisca vitripennis]